MTTLTTTDINDQYWTLGVPDIINEAKSFKWIDEANGLQCDWINGVKRNSTAKWFSLDNEENFNKLKLNPPHKDWNYTSDNVNYTFNSLGYRGDEIDTPSNFTILVCGSSSTFGTGLDDTQIWPYHLKQRFNKEKINNTKLINLGVAGVPNDYITRLLYRSIDTIKPDLVVVLYAWLNWGEFIQEDGTVIHKKLVPDQSAGFDNITVRENFIKNFNMVNLICKNTRLISLKVRDLKTVHSTVKEKLGRDDSARDGWHLGPSVHKEFANQLYAEANNLLFPVK